MTVIKQQYSDIEEICNDIPDWQKRILTTRLQSITKNPERVKPIEGLFEVPNQKANKL